MTAALALVRTWCSSQSHQSFQASVSRGVLVSQAAPESSVSSPAQCHPWSPGPSGSAFARNLTKYFLKQICQLYHPLPTPVHSEPQCFYGKKIKEQTCHLLFFLVFLFPDSVPTSNFISLSLVMCVMR